MAVEVSQVALGLPSGWLVGAQTVGAFMQNADADVASTVAVYVSQVYMTAGTGVVVRSATAAQTVGAFSQSVEVDVVSDVAVDVSWASLQVPEGSSSTNNASASQTVGSFVTSASMFDIIGSISGGGTISNELPHRSASGAQTVGVFQTSANVGEEGTLGPILAQAAQFVASFSQSATADARADASANQGVGDFRMSALMFDPQPRPRRGGGPGHGPKIRRHGKRYMAEVDGVTIVADTLAELQRKVQRLMRDASQEPQKAAQETRKVTKVVEVADPVPVTPEPIPVAEVERMVADFIAQQQALVDQYQAEVANLKLASVANTASLKASMMREVEQRVAQAAGDMDAVVALMMDESIPQSTQIPFPVVTPAALPKPAPKPAPKPEPVEVMAGEIGKLSETIAELQAQVSAPREVIRDSAGKVTGVKIGDTVRSVKRDKAGRISGA